MKSFSLLLRAFGFSVCVLPLLPFLPLLPLDLVIGIGQQARQLLDELEERMREIEASKAAQSKPPKRT